MYFSRIIDCSVSIFSFSQDVNECSINNGNCQDKCFNTYGSYSCQCRVGFKISEDQRSCQGNFYLPECFF